MSTATTANRTHRPANGRRSRKASATERGPSPEEKLVADLIALMERGTAPWRREWQAHQGAHRNLLTGHAYRGSNPLLLEFGALLKGHTGAYQERSPLGVLLSAPPKVYSGSTITGFGIGC